MKIAHISDLHLGKSIYNYSIWEDQKDILQKITDILKKEQASALLIAGDVYDKAIASTEAVKIFDAFIVNLSKAQIKVFIISGNHDSGERISFGADLMALSGVHIAKPLTKSTKDIKPFVLKDEFGPLYIYLLPFIKPIHVKVAFETDEIESYTQAVKTVVDAMQVDPSARNILVAHQFVTGATRCDSEQVSVGGSDNVDSSAFDAFDYVALGHLHGPQHVTRETVRYCGSPLKYSFSEIKHTKSVTILDVREKGNIQLKTIPLIPLRDWQEIKGRYEEIMKKEFYEKLNRQDFFRITLTDEEDVPNAIEKLRTVYPHVVVLAYDNKRTATNGEVGTLEEAEQKTPFEIFAEFYQKQNNQPLSEQQSAYMRNLIEQIWEEK